MLMKLGLAAMAATVLMAGQSGFAQGRQIPLSRDLGNEIGNFLSKGGGRFSSGMHQGYFNLTANVECSNASGMTEQLMTDCSAQPLAGFSRPGQSDLVLPAGSPFRTRVIQFLRQYKLENLIGNGFFVLGATISCEYGPQGDEPTCTATSAY